MSLPTRMISVTGNNKKGFTFIEIMIALVILSSGIVMIYKSFFLCVDYLSYLTCRLYAAQLIETKISDISRSYRESQDSTFDRGALTESIEVNRKWVDFNFNIEMAPIGNMELVYRLKVDLFWHDGRRLMKLSRESLLSKI